MSVTTWDASLQADKLPFSPKGPWNMLFFIFTLFFLYLLYGSSGSFVLVDSKIMTVSSGRICQCCGISCWSHTELSGLTVLYGELGLECVSCNPLLGSGVRRRGYNSGPFGVKGNVSLAFLLGWNNEPEHLRTPRDG